MDTFKQSTLSKKGWKHHFERRDKAASEGRHLPTVDELFAGMSFFKNSFKVDAQIWAERLLATQIGKPQDANGGEVLDALERITVSFTIQDFENVETCMRYYGLGSQGPDYHVSSVQRCVIYRAMAGDMTAIPLVCTEIAEHFRKTFYEPDEGKANLTTLLGLLFALRNKSLAPEARFDSMKMSYLSARTYLTNIFDHPPEAPSNGDMINCLPKSSKPEPLLNDNTGKCGMIVFSEIGNDHTHKDREFAFEPVRPFLNKRIPLIEVPLLDTVRSKLIFEYPQATAIVDRILNDLVGRDHIAIRPTILVGDPGSGKTSFAMRLCELLCVAFETYNCSTTWDNSFAGTARRWVSAEPAFPAGLILRTKIANPAIILDEIDKAGGSVANGKLADSLLPMIEPNSAKVFHDICLQSKVDLTGLNWLGTSNDPKLIPKSLRDRFQLIKFPSPDKTHILPLADQLLTSICREDAIDPRWVEKLSGIEIEALSDAWPGGSLRALRQLIRGVLVARDKSAPRH